jgi:predicted DNA-binding transcriptional regulator AlpA
MVEREYLFSNDLEEMTGIPASTWRFWAVNNQGPHSFLLGRRRVWAKADVDAWLIEQAQKNAQPADA